MQNSNSNAGAEAPQSTTADVTISNQTIAKPNVGRSFTNVFVEIDGKLLPIRELPKIEYEEFLEGMHRLRLAYISVINL